MAWGDRYGSLANVKSGTQNFVRNVRNRGIRPKVLAGREVSSKGV